MSVNSSSSAAVSFGPPHLSSNSSVHPFLECYTSRTSIFGFSAFYITYILLLPLPIYVVHLGYQRWRKQRCMSATGTSHSDVITYHSIVMLLTEVFGFTFFLCGSYAEFPKIMFAGFCIWSVMSLGQGLFHLLTCVERYLAVVHPVTYLRLKQASGVKIRDSTIGFVWALIIGWIPVIYLVHHFVSLAFYFCTSMLLLAVISFCSVSVLCALKRPGPGEGGGNRERADQSKQRAFHTIFIIMAVLLVSFGGNVLFSLMNTSAVLSDICVSTMFTMWFELPSKLVLPLLCLHRTGKLHCRRQN